MFDAGAVLHGGPYPSRSPAPRSRLEPVWRQPFLLACRVAGGWRRPREAFVSRVLVFQATQDGPHATGWSGQVRVLARDLRRFGCADAPLARAFGMARAAWRARFESALSDEAVVGARGLLRGAVVELADVEARVSAIAVAAVIAGLAGRRTHVAMRSAEDAVRAVACFAPLYDLFGLSTAALSPGLPADERRTAYGADIVYAAHRDLANDILRDMHRLRDYGEPLDLHVARIGNDAVGTTLLTRGLEFVIVCDADRVLIDEARIPISVSRAVSQSRDVAAFRDALELAAHLVEDRDFTFDEDFSVTLTDAGRERAESGAAAFDPESPGARFWELIRLAICAEHLLERGREYVVREGRVLLSEQAAIQPVLGAAWQGGLRQMVELREGCTVTPRSETLARSSFMRVFRRYRFVAAVSGHAAEAERAFRSVYGWWLLRPRARLPALPQPVLFRGEAAKWEAIVERVRAVNAEGRAVLVRLRTAESAEALGARLRAAGLECQIVQSPAALSDAMPPGRSVERGSATLLVCPVDETLGAFLRSCLREDQRVHVVLGEADESRRHTAAFCELLRGACRSATIESIWSGEDAALVRHAHPVLRMLSGLGSAARPVPLFLARALLRSGTRRAERSYRRSLRDGVRAEEIQAGLLAFSGGSD